MRFKQKTALLLASVMLVGSVGIMNTTEVRAKEPAANTFTLTVPADTYITKSGWNDIGNIGVSNVSIASDKKISVTIENGATGRSLVNTTDSNKKVGYEIKKGNATTNEAFGTSLDFTENGTQTIGADVEDFSKAVAGTYEDTINFTATLEDAALAVTYNRTGKTALSSANLGTPKDWEYSGTTYQVYNEFIPSSSGSNWNDAVGFVKALNDANYDGHDDWILLSSEEMAKAYAKSETGAMPDSSERGAVTNLWSSVEFSNNRARCLKCADGSWSYSSVTNVNQIMGFVVLRESSNAPASTAVTYERTGKTALSSENLGEPTSWEYGGTTYQVYNAFIPLSSGSSWNDAKGFVDALNDANYDGHEDWTLLSSKAMAEAYAQSKTGAMPDSSERGGVYALWSSVAHDENNACYLNCSIGTWDWNGRSGTDSFYGFVVLRESESSESTGVEYPLTGSEADGKKLTSAALLASKTADASTYSTFEYNGTTYTAYNGYVSETKGANWNDAIAFVNLLNDNEVDDCDSWALLTNRDMAYIWWLSTDSVEKKGAYHVGGNYNMWSSDSNGDKGYYWDCYQARSEAEKNNGEYTVKSNAWKSDNKSHSLENIGFVVLRGSSDV